MRIYKLHAGAARPSMCHYLHIASQCRATPASGACLNSLSTVFHRHEASTCVVWPSASVPRAERIVHMVQTMQLGMQPAQGPGQPLCGSPSHSMRHVTYPAKP